MRLQRVKSDIMERIHRRYRELVNKAKGKLKGRENIETELMNAIVEISFLRKDEVPTFYMHKIDFIMDAAGKHKSIGGEGNLMESISKMTHLEKQEMKEAILNL